MTSLTLGVIGCGAIGSEICRASDAGRIPARLTHVCDLDKEKVQRLTASLKTKPKPASVQEICAQCDIVVEAAHPNVVPEILKAAFEKRPLVVVMSVGGLLMGRELYDRALNEGIEVRFPSGAVSGLDTLRAAAEEGLTKVLLRTTKPPRALAGAPFIEENKIDLGAIKEKTIIFHGTAAKAIRAFPTNINVAAELSLTALGPERVEVEIVADPASTSNQHEVFVEGKFGKLYTRTENVPSPTNPKTSYLAVLSAVELVKRLAKIRSMR